VVSPTVVAWSLNQNPVSIAEVHTDARAIVLRSIDHQLVSTAMLHGTFYETLDGIRMVETPRITLSGAIRLNDHWTKVTSD